MDLLMAAAILPGLYLVYYVYQQDKIEKEPTDLLVKLLGFGALSVVFAVIMEGLADSVLTSFFDKKSTTYLLLENFLGVALVEEYGKYFVLKRLTWRDKAFDYRFDAVVYAVCASMGFAILENILYVFEHGMSVAILRAVTSLPGHCIFGIYMGLYYGEAKLCEARGNIKGMNSQLSSALWVPVFLHGLYDYCLSGNGDLALFFIIYVLVLDWRAYKRLKAASAADTHI